MVPGLSAGRAELCQPVVVSDDQPIGQRLEFVYAEETYRIELLDDATLRWTRTVGDPVGATDVERYVWSRIDDERWMITWIEATGLGLSSVVDTATGRLITHANDGREVFTNLGEARPLP